MSIDPSLWARIQTLAADGYRESGHFPLHFARGKLGHDPLFRDVLALLSRIRQEERLKLLDLGCGQGLLEAAMIAYQRLATSAGDGELPPLPLSSAKGYDLMQHNVAWAQAMLAHGGDKPFEVAISQGDIGQRVIESSDICCLFDVLHYLDFATQESLLKRIYASLNENGQLLLRVGDAARWRQKASNLVDRVVVMLRGHGWQPLYVRPQKDWVDLLARMGFEVKTVKTYISFTRVNTLVQCIKTGNGDAVLGEQSSNEYKKTL